MIKWFFMFMILATNVFADTHVVGDLFVSNLASCAYGVVTDSFGKFSCASSGGGVSQIIAGTNVTISPSGGTGSVTINASGGGGSIPDPLSLTGFQLIQDGSGQSGLAWEPYTGGTTLESPAGGQVYIQGAGETALGGILLFSPTVQLYNGGSGVSLQTQGLDDLNLNSGAGSVHIGPTGGGYGTYISGNGGVQITSGGGMSLSAYAINLGGAITFPDYTGVGTYNEGEIAYNYSTHRPCFYDGSNWNDL